MIFKQYLVYSVSLDIVVYKLGVRKRHIEIERILYLYRHFLRRNIERRKIR
jgi:hypothetical protein